MRGADLGTVERALHEGDPLPGTRGFAGALLDVDGSRPSARGTSSHGGRLVRDVLGRELVYSDAANPGVWSHDPADLADPDLVPAGHVRDATRDGVRTSPASAGSSDERRESDGVRDEEVWTLPDPEPFADEATAVAAVRDAITASVDEALGVAADPESAAPPVAFSGGVDSTVLAALSDGPLYVVGFEGCHDVDAARSAAAALDREVTVLELTHDDLRRAVPAVARATGRTNAMAVGIALPLFLVAERVVADGFDRLALGQGADELFGGYDKVAKAPEDPRVEADTVRGAVREMTGTLPAQLERDVRAVRAAGAEPVSPLLDDRVVEAALRLPPDLLVSGGERKRGLRLAASDFLPEEVAFRDKKAVQYGTYVARELDRLARENGFKRRMDDHVTRYVESLL